MIDRLVTSLLLLLLLLPLPLLLLSFYYVLYIMGLVGLYS